MADRKINTGLTEAEVHTAFYRALHDLTDAQIQAMIAEEAASRLSADSAISAETATKLSSLDVFKGTEITAGIDLNTLMAPGTYWCASSTVAQTLYNCPISGSGFVLQVFTTGSRVELLYPVSAGLMRIFMRCYTGGSSGSWKSWYMYESTLSENQGTQPPNRANRKAAGTEANHA